MHWIGWVVSAAALVEGGWLAFDGAHALITGDYVTPNSGSCAGQLGPWSKLVSSVGIEPRSTLMKSIHLVIGVTWMIVLICFQLRVSWSWTGMMLCAVAGLWYLPFGTLLSIMQIILLALPPLRSAGTAAG